MLAAAALHAGWNAFLKLDLEPFLAMTLITTACGIVGLPLLAIYGLPVAAAWPWLLGSIVLHLAYYVTLTAAYARADMSQIYPIARGGAPLLTAAASSLLLPERIGTPQLVGIAGLGLGVLAMSAVGRRRGSAFDPVAIALALATAATICGYTLVDGIGARIAGDAGAYASTLFVIDAVPLAALAIWRRGIVGLEPLRPYLAHGLAAGAMAFGSYWIAIWAMTVAPIALVAALRETSVLFAAVIAIVILKEPLQWPRALAAGIILAGLALIRLG